MAFDGLSLFGNLQVITTQKPVFRWDWESGTKFKKKKTTKET